MRKKKLEDYWSVYLIGYPVCVILIVEVLKWLTN